MLSDAAPLMMPLAGPFFTVTFASPLTTIAFGLTVSLTRMTVVLFGEMSTLELSVNAVSSSFHAFCEKLHCPKVFLPQVRSGT